MMKRTSSRQRVLPWRLLFLLTCVWQVTAQENHKPTVVRVDAANTLHKIPRSIFGTFLEPIGNSIYGGLWAQILQNPSLEANLWEACRLHARPQLEDLAQRIRSTATWANIVLPAPQLLTLQTIGMHARHRAKEFITRAITRRTFPSTTAWGNPKAMLAMAASLRVGAACLMSGCHARCRPGSFGWTRATWLF